MSLDLDIFSNSKIEYCHIVTNKASYQVDMHSAPMPVFFKRLLPIAKNYTQFAT